MLTYAEKLDFDMLSSGVDRQTQSRIYYKLFVFPSYATLAEEMELRSKGVTHQDILIARKKITVLSETMVLLTAFGEATAFTNDVRQFKAGFHWSFIYQKFGNDWKVIYSHQSASG